MDSAPLSEYTKDEWWDICQQLATPMSREQFNEFWEVFCEIKKRKSLQ